MKAAQRSFQPRLPLLHNPRGRCPRFPFSDDFDAGWNSPVARQAHNLKVVGSNPTPATNKGRGGSRGTDWRPCLAFEAALEGVSRRELCRKRLAARGDLP